MNILDRIPRQTVAWVYLGVVFYALAMPGGVARDYLLLGLGFGGTAVAALAFFVHRDLTRLIEATLVIRTCHDRSHQMLDQAVAERDAWKAEAERLREFLKSTTGVTLK